MPAKKRSSQNKAAKKPLNPTQEARSETTSAMRLGELAEESTALARLVARNPSAPEPVLKELGSHADATVRKWVTVHPSTPPSVLIKLATQFPEQLLDNSIFDLLLLENPNLLNELPVGTRRSLLKREKCPVSFLEWLAEDDDEGVQLALAMNANTPGHILDKLSKSKSRKISSTARRHVHYSAASDAPSGGSETALAAALREELLDPEDQAAAQRMLPWLPCVGEVSADEPLGIISKWSQNQAQALPLARNLHTDPAVLEALATSPWADVRLAVSKNRSTPISVLVQLADDTSNDVRVAVARNRSTPISVLVQLADATSKDVRLAVARNRYIPDELLVRLSEDKTWDVRAKVGGNPATPFERLKRLSRDKNPNVRVEVAGNRSSPKSVLEKLAKDGAKMVLFEVAANPCTPAPVLDELADSKESLIRALVAKNPGTGGDALARLAKDRAMGTGWSRFVYPNHVKLKSVFWGPTYIVRLQVATNPSTPPSVLAELMKESQEILHSAAHNKNARLHDVIRVARQNKGSEGHSGLWSFWWALDRHSAAFAEEDRFCRCEDPEILRVLAKSIFPERRMSVAENRWTPSDALEELAADKDSRVRWFVAENSSTPLEALEVLAKDRDWLRKLAVEHPFVTPAILRQLGTDRSASVREAVAGHRAAPADVLEALAKDRFRSKDYFSRGKPTVREAVARNPSAPTGALRILARDPDSMVRYLVATNPATPKSLLKILAQEKDGDDEVQRVAAGRLKRGGTSRQPAVGPRPKKGRPRLKPRPVRDLDVVLAGLPGVAHLVSGKYVQSNNLKMRCRLAGNPLLPKKYAAELAKDSSKSVRRELARNPGVSGRVLELLVQDHDNDVAKAARAESRRRERAERRVPLFVARSTRTGQSGRTKQRTLPPPVKTDLRKLNDWQHLAKLAPEEMERVMRLEWIPKSKRAAKRKELAEAFIKKYSGSNRPSFKRLLCLLLPDCPIPVLAKAGRSTDWKERLAIASHPKTPPAIRQRLANDGNEFVRVSAQAMLGINADPVRQSTRN